MATGAEIKAELDSIGGMGQEFNQRANEMGEQINTLQGMVSDTCVRGAPCDADAVVPGAFAGRLQRPAGQR